MPETDSQDSLDHQGQPTDPGGDIHTVTIPKAKGLVICGSCVSKVVGTVNIAMVSGDACRSDMVWAVRKTVKVLSGRGTNCTKHTNNTNH